MRLATPRSSGKGPRPAIIVLSNTHHVGRARRLGTPLATISRKVSELEEHLKTRLLNRSSRRLTLTDAAELVAIGRVNADSFGGLRTLLVPSEKRRATTRAGHRRRAVTCSMGHSSRWALARRIRLPQTGPQPAPEAATHVACTLLLRYGAIFQRLLEREADWLPPWRDLLNIYRNLETRGEIRGGRFVAGFAGEQFALPDVVGMLREVRLSRWQGWQYRCLVPIRSILWES
jgi:hypothetical protein